MFIAPFRHVPTVLCASHTSATVNAHVSKPQRVLFTTKFMNAILFSLFTEVQYKTSFSAAI